MRITYKMEGGLAAFPGLMGAVTIDTAELAPEEAAELSALVSQCNFFEAPQESKPPAGADQRCYALTVEDEGRERTLRIPEPMPEPLRPLVERTRALARKKRGRRGEK